VDSCVNLVGVNLNTASTHLLSHVSGIGPALAKALVDRRAGQGLFRSRQQLMEVPRFSRKSYEQAAGFLRIPGGDHPLDATGVHPERYPVLESLAQRLEKDVSALLGPGVEMVRQAEGLREELGAYTFDDVVRELEKPGRDPREAFVPFQYRADVRELADLKPGMKCPGIVTNVTNFGAFVDIGVHHDGLVHVSRLSDRFVKDPREVVHPGMHVEVRVLEVNLEKRQLALTMKSERPRTPPAAARRERETRQPVSGTPPGRVERPRPTAAQDGRRPVGSSRPRPAGARPRPTPDNRPRGRADTRLAATSAARAPLNNPFAVLAELKKTLKQRNQ